MVKAKEKMRDEMFKYRRGHKGLKQFTLDEVNNTSVLKWRRRAKNNK